MSRLVGLLFMMVVGCVAHAAPGPLALDPGVGHYAIGPQAEYLEDASKRFALRDVSTPAMASRWQPWPGQTFSLGYSESAFWFAFSLRGPPRSEWLLEINYPLLDHVELFVLARGAATQHLKTGDHSPFRERAVFHRNFVLPVRLGDDGAARVYLRVESTTAIRLPLTLWKERALYEADQLVLLTEALYYGVILSMVLYNLFIFFVIRDRSYLFYVFAIGFIAVFIASFHGILYQFLWANWMPYWWNDRLPAFAALAASLFACLFTSSFLELRQKYVWWYRLFVIIELAIGAIAIGVLALPYAVAVKLTLSTVLVVDIGALSAGYYAWWRGQPSASYFAFSWTLLLVGAIAMALNLLGVVPSNFFTDHSLQIGSALDAVLLSFALAHRLRQATYQAAHDPLTGLVNRREFEHRVRMALSQTTSGERRHALFYIDLDQFKAVNDALGHAAGDELLRQVTQLFQSRLRESDTLARLGGDEFAVLLTNCPPEQAERIAGNLLDAIGEFRFTWQHRTSFVGASIGVVRFTSGEQTVTALLNAADAACYMAKEKGRNRVQVHGEIA